MRAAKSRAWLVSPLELACGGAAFVATANRTIGNKPRHRGAAHGRRSGQGRWACLALGVLQLLQHRPVRLHLVLQAAKLLDQGPVLANLHPSTIMPTAALFAS